MTRNTEASLVYAATIAAAAVSAALVSTSTYAQCLSIDNPPPAGSKTLPSVQADLRIPFIGGDSGSSTHR